MVNSKNIGLPPARVAAMQIRAGNPRAAIHTLKTARRMQSRIGGKGKARLIRYNGEEYIHARRPCVKWIRGQLRPCTIETVTRLAPGARLGVPPAVIGADSVSKSVGERIKEWWAKTKEWLREATIKALKSPLSVLVAGALMIALPAWGWTIAALYLGARAGLALGRPGSASYVDDLGNVLQIASVDEYGRVAYDAGGYAWRDSAYKKRYDALPESGKADWRPMKDGRFRSAKPIPGKSRPGETYVLREV